MEKGQEVVRLWRIVGLTGGGLVGRGLATCTDLGASGRVTYRLVELHAMRL